MEYEVGKYYKVVCMECKHIDWQDKVEVLFVPIIDILHRDPQFGPKLFHYHVDGRFANKKVQSEFCMNEGRTNTAVWMYDQNQRWVAVKKIEKKLQCKRSDTGIITDTLKYDSRYWKWYRSMIGKSCAGKKCPHLGTEMLERNWKLVCPMHGLTGDIATEKIINKKLTKNAGSK